MSVLELNGRVFDASTTGTLTLTGEGSATTDVTQGLAKAWGHYEGNETAALQDSFNMGSITDIGTGRHSVTFTNNMANVFYAASSVGSTHRNGQTDTDSHAATGITFEFTAANSDNFTDSAQCQFHVMGDLA